MTINRQPEPFARQRLGQSDLWLSPVGLGTWQFSQGQGLVGRFWPQLDAGEIKAIVDAAYAHGMNWFDTAEIYGNGQSERALADALQELGLSSDEVYIATKWWPVLRRAGHLSRSIGGRLKQLQGYPIALYQIHQPFSLSSIEKQMAQMARLIDAGYIRYAGVSNFSAAQMLRADRALKAHGHQLVSNQVRYHLLDRRIERNGVLSLAQDLGISIIAYSPLAQGLLTTKFHTGHVRPQGFRRWHPQFHRTFLQRIAPLIEALTVMAEHYRVTPAQVALNWVISTPGQVVFAIAGATRVAQAVDNAGAMGWRLSASDRDALSRLSESVLTRLAD
jgi:aryl-alcohol dehydrogenase-like predicted oxidoreductase